MNKYIDKEGFTYIIKPLNGGRLVKVISGEMAVNLFIDVNSDIEALQRLEVEEPKFISDDPATLVIVSGKPMKIIGTETLPRGRKVFQHNHNPIPVEPVPVIVVEER